MQINPNITFGGGPTESTMSPIALAAMVVTVILIFALPRKKIIIPFLLFTFLVPLGEQFNIGGLHLFAQRIVILCGCLRFLPKLFSTRNSIFAGGFTWIDKLFLLWAFCRAAAFIILYQQGAAVANQLGFLWDFLGAYFLVRYLIRDVNDIRMVAKVFLAIAVIMAGCMIYEKETLTNVFTLIMGGGLNITPEIREGHIRCRGVFNQEILASAFGGTLVPFFWWLWKSGTSKIGAVVGVISSVIITVTASSSTGVGAGFVGVVVLCLWPARRNIRWILWGIVFAIAALAVVMKAPVWFLLDHVDFAGGSTGWDRANLIDQCVRHFWDWWLVGTSQNASWGYFTWDLCNQFVAEAAQGGLATLILFVALITQTFRVIGMARKRAHRRAQEWLLWTVGAVMCAHMAAFFGISYFDQTRVWWFVTLAMVPAAAMQADAVARKRRPLVPDAVSITDSMSPVNELVRSTLSGRFSVEIGRSGR